MGIKSEIFYTKGKPAFKKLTPSQNGWIIDNGAVQHVWRTLKRAGFDYLETRRLNQYFLENTFGVIRLHCGSNFNPAMGQFVDALKTIIIRGITNTGLHNANTHTHIQLKRKIPLILDAFSLMVVHFTTMR
jgi:hypothetical protein